jgi:hypothetical protein
MVYTYEPRKTFGTPSFSMGVRIASPFFRKFASVNSYRLIKQAL